MTAPLYPPFRLAPARTCYQTWGVPCLTRRHQQISNFIAISAILLNSAYTSIPPHHMPATIPLRQIALLFATLAVATGAWADSDGEAPYLADLPVVLSATRLPQPLQDIPGAVTIIDRKLLQATGYRDLARIFRLVPGMQVGQERGHAQWVTYHGLSSDYPTEMQVLIDGRSVITPSAFGGVDWSALPLATDDIDRIEIVRGTNANGYGANAMLGIINIITRHAAEDPGTSVGGRAGSGGIQDTHARWSGGSDPVALRASVETRRDEGFDGLNDNRRMDALTVRGDWQPNAHDSMMLRAAASEGRRGEGYPNSLFGNNALRSSHNQSYSAHLQWRHSANAGDEWLLSYYRNQERIHDRWLAGAPALGFPGVPLDRDRHSVRDNIELHHRSTPTPTLQLVWGAEARRDEVDSPMLFFSGNPDPQHLYRLFGNLEWRATDTVSVNLGGVQEKYSRAPSHFSPRAFMNWQATPHHTLRGGVARAWRQHHLFDAYGDYRAIDPTSGATLARPYLPNPDLRQTHIDTLELGYFGRFDAIDTTLDVRVFNERIHDFVVRAPQPDPDPAPLLSPSGPLPAPHIGSTRYENLERPITLRGVEYQLITRPRPETEIRLAHSLIERRSRITDIDNRTAPYTASLSWLQNYGDGWSSMVSILRMGPLAGGDRYIPGFRYRAPPYTTVDVNIVYSIRIGTRPARFALTALNLGDRHQEFADLNEQAVSGSRAANPVSRSLFLSASIAFD